MNCELMLRIAFYQNRLIATGVFTLDKPYKGNISLSLSNSFQMTKCQGGGAALKWTKTREYRPTFQVPSQEITISCEHEITELTCTYEGPVGGWLNLITGDIKALSSYSSWFPFALADQYNKPLQVRSHIVRMNAPPNSFLIKGRMDEERNEWVYGEDSEYDACNILLLNMDQYFVSQNADISVYYNDRNEEAQARKCINSYRQILDYYENCLYPKMRRSHFDIVSISDPEAGGGAYFRKELVVIDYLSGDYDLPHLLAHELGHGWCTGAVTGSWEDWLNETTAEWSALLFELHQKRDTVFHDRIKWKEEVYPDHPPIQTEDGSRPQGVHDKGTILFYWIFQRYGKESIEKLLQIFTGLREKNTANFLRQVSEYRPEIAEFIRSNLRRTLFSEENRV